MPTEREHHSDLDHIGEGKDQRDLPGQLSHPVGRKASKERKTEKQPFICEPRAQQEHHGAGIGQPYRGDRVPGAGQQQAEAGQRQKARSPQQRADHRAAINRSIGDARPRRHSRKAAQQARWACAQTRGEVRWGGNRGLWAQIPIDRCRIGGIAPGVRGLRPAPASRCIARSILALHRQKPCICYRKMRQVSGGTSPETEAIAIDRRQA